ncbi:hypothetical protein ACROYT_G042353 [Oculina patagonica]
MEKRKKNVKVDLQSKPEGDLIQEDLEGKKAVVILTEAGNKLCKLLSLPCDILLISVQCNGSVVHKKHLQRVLYAMKLFSAVELESAQKEASSHKCLYGVK